MGTAERLLQWQIRSAMLCPCSAGMRLRVAHAEGSARVDERAESLLAAGRSILPHLDELLGPERAVKVRKDLTRVLDDAQTSWDAEEVRDILFGYAKTKKYLLDAVGEAEDARTFSGGGGGRWWF